MSKKNDNFFIWTGIYQSWNEACKAANIDKNKNSHDRKYWSDRITQQLLNYRLDFKKNSFAMPPRPCSLPSLVSITNSDSILDFGGSSGWCFDYLNNSVYNKLLKSYQIIETEFVVDFMKKSLLHSHPVEYSTINDKIKSCNILYCNSVLQYFESNHLLIDLIKKSNPDYVLLDDLVAIKNQFFTLQNSYDIKIPYRFIGLDNLLKDIFLEGYVELCRYPYPGVYAGVTKKFPMDNFPKVNKIDHSLTIMFKKRYGV